MFPSTITSRNHGYPSKWSSGSGRRNETSSLRVVLSPARGRSDAFLSSPRRKRGWGRWVGEWEEDEGFCPERETRCHGWEMDIRASSWNNGYQWVSRCFRIRHTHTHTHIHAHTHTRTCSDEQHVEGTNAGDRKSSQISVRALFSSSYFGAFVSHFLCPCISIGINFSIGRFDWLLTGWFKW